MSIVNLEKVSYKNDTLGKVIDRNFTQFTLPEQAETQFNIDDFFQLYDNLFYTIPKDGELESHQYILNKTIEYLGVKLADDVDLNALLEEITALRQQLLESQNLVSELSK